MNDDRETARLIARAWFERLPPIPQAFALIDLPVADRIMVVAGVVTTSMPREDVVRLLRRGDVRIAPRDCGETRSKCPLVVMDPSSGFPLLIEARRREPYGRESS